MDYIKDKGFCTSKDSIQNKNRIKNCNIYNNNNINKTSYNLQINEKNSK